MRYAHVLSLHYKQNILQAITTDNHNRVFKKRIMQVRYALLCVAQKIY